MKYLYTLMIAMGFSLAFGSSHPNSANQAKIDNKVIVLTNKKTGEKNYIGPNIFLRIKKKGQEKIQAGYVKEINNDVLFLENESTGINFNDIEFIRSKYDQTYERALTRKDNSRSNSRLFGWFAGIYFFLLILVIPKSFSKPTSGGFLDFSSWGRSIARFILLFCLIISSIFLFLSIGTGLFFKKKKFDLKKDWNISTIEP